MMGTLIATYLTATVEWVEAYTIEDAEFAGLRARADIHEVRAAWWIAFNGMLLEGLEVWLIVVALGVQTHHTLVAASAALVALLVVCGAGAVARKPLAKVPENTIKFTVGSGILSFGTFFGEASLPALFGFYLIGGIGLIRLYRAKLSKAGAV
jgi:uncharacterized membrane protein